MIEQTASLPMYDFPPLRPSRTAFWLAVLREVAAEGFANLPASLDFSARAVPERLLPSMLFSQVCGYPLQTIFRGQARMLAAPVYDVPHCDGPTHAGVFIVRRDAAFADLAALRQTHFAYNSRHSNSGMNLPRRALADIAGGRPFFASVRETHGHPASLALVLAGEVDATCVDNVTFANYAICHPQQAEELRILALTPPSPSLPFVTSSSTKVSLADALQRALLRVGSALEYEAARAGMLLKAVVPVDPPAYPRLLEYEREAAVLGYPALL
jgi:ABC-type phosphate/phosphonate transport system substrate-binding protein